MRINGNILPREFQRVESLFDDVCGEVEIYIHGPRPELFEGIAHRHTCSGCNVKEGDYHESGCTGESIAKQMALGWNLPEKTLGKVRYIDTLFRCDRCGTPHPDYYMARSWPRVVGIAAHFLCLDCYSNVLRWADEADGRTA